MKDVDVVQSTPTKSSEDVDETSTSNQNTLTVNKIFVVNTLKQVDDHNRIKSNQESKLLRKFQNEQRKKHTVKNLKKFSSGKTLYSDLIFIPAKKHGKVPVSRTKVITPLEQVKKLVCAAADYDEMHEQVAKKIMHKPRISLDKTLLKNHLRHTSVHNRLQEETEMWDQHESQETKKSIKLRIGKRKPFSGITGGMYSDLEPGKVKVTRIKTTPDQPCLRFGTATRELLDFEESIPDRWGHSGFKEIYEDELTDLSPIDSNKRKASLSPIDRNKRKASRKIYEDELTDLSPIDRNKRKASRKIYEDELTDLSPIDRNKRKASRKIVIANSQVSRRLDNSIELSDDEITVSRNKRKIKGKVVVNNKLKRMLKSSPRKITINKAFNVDREIPTKKKSVIMVVPKSSRAKVVAKQKLEKAEKLRRRKKVLVKRNTGTLQSDLIVEAEKSRQIRSKRDASPKWEHDGFQEIIDDSEDSDDDDNDISIRKSAKSRLGIVNLTNSDDDSGTSTDSLKITSQRRKLIAVKNKIKRRSKSNNSVSNKVDKVEIHSPVQLSDSEEWTEKQVDRVTLRNSLHSEKVKKSVKSRLGKINDGKSPSKVNRKRTSSKDNGDSSFTDSSGDEQYRKRIDVKKKRLQRFSTK